MPIPAAQTYSEAEAAAMLREIDPLGGTWKLLAFDGPPLPAGRRATMEGHEGAYLNTLGHCTSSYSSYVRDGARLTITRHIPPETGKCEDPAAASLDRALAHAVASAQSWRSEGDRLFLLGADGKGASFARRVPVRPGLDGKWLVESVGGKPFSGTISFGDDFVSGYAGCNSFGGQATIGAGTIAVRDGVQTAMGCGKAAEALDSVLFGALNGASSWRIEGDGTLRLDGRTTIIARRPPPRTFGLPGRYSVCNNSTLPDISHDGDVWIEFAADRVTDSGGCGAAYTTSGAALSLTLDDVPACRTPALPPRGAYQIGGPARSPLAQFRPDGFAWDGEGRLRLRTPRGLLAMCRIEPG